MRDVFVVQIQIKLAVGIRALINCILALAAQQLMNKPNTKCVFFVNNEHQRFGDRFMNIHCTEFIPYLIKLEPVSFNFLFNTKN